MTTTIKHDGHVPLAAAGAGARKKSGVAARILVLLPVVMLVLVCAVVLTQRKIIRGTMRNLMLKEIMTKPSNQSNVEQLHHSSRIAVKKYSTSEACVTPEMIGTWTYVDTPNFTSTLCCDPNEFYPRGHPFCEFRRRRDRVSLDFQGSPTHLPWMQGNGCAAPCKASFRDHYVWTSPNLPRWDASEFCRLLGPRRRILMVGDSTMGQTATTLMTAVHGFCQTQLFYFISDTLIQEPYGQQNRGSHWLDIVGRNYSTTDDGDDDIVVLTVGAHIGNIHGLMNVSEIVIQQIRVLKEERPNITIVYKTQQPGGCTSDIANVSLSPLEVGEKLISTSTMTYNHHLFYEYDKAVIRRLQEFDILFLDLRMLYSRSDAHPGSKPIEPCQHWLCDCLHFCSPGPLDTFAILFLHLLRNNFSVSQCV